MTKDVFERMKESWPSAVLARTEVSRFTGGLISEKYLANLDSLGIGCPGRIRVGRRVAYPVEQFCEWLRSRTKEADASDG
ncbi:MAG: hypothetical protein K9M96_07310 [Deltaproteobacteria bacterium]|nr:hypothetical protein [Deltaproteobacteria bacterium]